MYSRHTRTQNSFAACTELASGLVWSLRFGLRSKVQKRGSLPFWSGGVEGGQGDTINHSTYVNHSE